jgi:hypothetical protein
MALQSDAYGDPVTLRQFFERIIEERSKAHSAELSAVREAQGLRDQALQEAKRDMDRRLEGMNEFRAEIERVQATFLRRDEYTISHTGLEKRLNDSEDASDKRMRALERLVWIGVGIALVINLMAGYLWKR